MSEAHLKRLGLSERMAKNTCRKLLDAYGDRIRNVS